MTTTSDPAAPAPPAPSAPIPAPRRGRGCLILALAVAALPLAMCVSVCAIGASGADVFTGTVLELDLESPLADGSPGLAQRFTGGGAATFSDVLFALERARTDERIVGVVARMGSGVGGLANAEELRDAIARFRASGKPAIAFAETFGEMSPGTGGYLVASAFDEIWLQPSGDVNLVPVFGETMFARGALDKAAVVPEFAARKEYKNAPNQYTEHDFTPAHREATVALLDGVARQIERGIAASRTKLGDAAAVRALVAGGPYSAQQALEKNLVDKLGYRDEMLAALAARVNATGPRAPRLLYPHVYLDRAGRPFDALGPVVDVIYALGPVTRGKNNEDPFSGQQSFGSDTTAALIRQSANDDSVKAIVLRVDSPGGSYIGSDAIWRAVELAKQKGKKVVASMGNVAASGGYFVSMGADSIVASNGTITGSIGVFGGKLVTAGLWEKAGVAFETIAVDGADPSLFSNDMPYSGEARAKLDASMDRIYTDFVTKAAQGRKKKFDEMEPLAHGRVWIGADAKERGLVDETGGLLRAIEVAKQLAGIEKDAPFKVRVLPKPKSPFETAIALARGDEGDNSDAPESEARAVTLERARLEAARAIAAIASEPAALIDPNLPRLSL